MWCNNRSSFENNLLWVPMKVAFKNFIWVKQKFFFIFVYKIFTFFSINLLFKEDRLLHHWCKNKVWKVANFFQKNIPIFREKNFNFQIIIFFLWAALQTWFLWCDARVDPLWIRLRKCIQTNNFTWSHWLES